MLDDHIDHYRAIKRLGNRDPLLAHVLELWAEEAGHVHLAMARCLRDISKLSGFTGSLTLGVRIGREPHGLDVPFPSWTSVFVQDDTSQDAIDDQLEFDGCGSEVDDGTCTEGRNDNDDVVQEDDGEGVDGREAHGMVDFMWSLERDMQSIAQQ